MPTTCLNSKSRGHKNRHTINKNQQFCITIEVRRSHLIGPGRPRDFIAIVILL